MQKAIEYLKKHDKVIAKIIDELGPIKLKKKENYYESLCQAIIFQQLSMKAASKIFQRFKEIHENQVTPEKTLLIGKKKIFETGISAKKAGYIEEMAKKFLAEAITKERMEKMNDEEIIEYLTSLKGIGLWTAQMFLIFSLGRQNVLPSTDLGFIKALQKNYGLKEKPDKEQINEIAKNWEPYKTIASLYIWATTDNGTEY